MESTIQLTENEKTKWFYSPEYQFVFDKQTGFFARWGKSKNDDPIFSPHGPEILDLEISAGGMCLGNCEFCYKGNGGNKEVKNMTFETFKEVFHKMPFYNNIPFLTQIAFGIMNINTNPDFMKMMRYAKSFGVIPNYTTHGLDLDEDFAKETAEVCGAVAVSIVKKEKTYDAIKMYTDAGMTQVNIHFMLSQERVSEAKSIVDDIASDPRLAKMNALVFLQYKHKNEKSPHHSVESASVYQDLIEYCESKKVRYGFDSCSFPLFAKSVEGKKYYNMMMTIGEPCESTLFSSYISWDNIFYPCSFTEKMPGWEEGINVLEVKDFNKDVWMSEKTDTFRQRVINSSKGCKNCPSQIYCRSCIVYEDVTACKKQCLS